jgi:hypothetical protein
MFVPKCLRFVQCRILVSLAPFDMVDVCSGPGACLVDFGQGNRKRKILAMATRWGNDVVDAVRL